MARKPAFTHQEKLQAAAELYLQGDSVRAADKLPFDISDRTIRQWRAVDADFQNHFSQLVEDNEEESRVKYRKIVQMGLDGVIDRIEHGNVKVIPIQGEWETDENGEYVRNPKNKRKVTKASEYREPMTSKDLTYTTGIFIDKHRVSLGQPSRITKQAESAEDMKGKFLDVFKEFQNTTEEKAAAVVSVQDKD